MIPAATRLKSGREENSVQQTLPRDVILFLKVNREKDIHWPRIISRHGINEILFHNAYILTTETDRLAPLACIALIVMEGLVRGNGIAKYDHVILILCQRDADRSWRPGNTKG